MARHHQVKRKGKTFYGHPRFYKILDELAELHSRKNHDYSGAEDPLGNLRECEEAGIDAWRGVIVRMTDKMSRLKSYSRQGTLLVNDEGLIDTFRDLSIYAILGAILFAESHER